MILLCGQIENSIILFEKPQSTWLSCDQDIFVIIGFRISVKIISIMILIVEMILVMRSENSRKTVSYEKLVSCSNQENLRLSNLSILNCLREVLISFSSQLNLVDKVLLRWLC